MVKFVSKQRLCVTRGGGGWGTKGVHYLRRKELREGEREGVWEISHFLIFSHLLRSWWLDLWGPTNRAVFFFADSKDARPIPSKNKLVDENFMESFGLSILIHLQATDSNSVTVLLPWIRFSVIYLTVKPALNGSGHNRNLSLTEHFNSPGVVESTGTKFKNLYEMKLLCNWNKFSPLLFHYRQVWQYSYFLKTASSHSHSVHLPHYSTLHNSLPPGQIKRTKDCGED